MFRHSCGWQSTCSVLECRCCVRAHTLCYDTCTVLECTRSARHMYCVRVQVLCQSFGTVLECRYYVRVQVLCQSTHALLGHMYCVRVQVLCQSAHSLLKHMHCVRVHTLLEHLYYATVDMFYQSTHECSCSVRAHVLCQSTLLCCCAYTVSEYTCTHKHTARAHGLCWSTCTRVECNICSLLEHTYYAKVHMHCESTHASSALLEYTHTLEYRSCVRVEYTHCARVHTLW